MWLAGIKPAPGMGTAASCAVQASQQHNMPRLPVQPAWRTSWSTRRRASWLRGKLQQVVLLGGLPPS